MAPVPLGRLTQPQRKLLTPLPAPPPPSSSPSPSPPPPPPPPPAADSVDLRDNELSVSQPSQSILVDASSASPIDNSMETESECDSEIVNAKVPNVINSASQNIVSNESVNDKQVINNVSEKQSQNQSTVDVSQSSLSPSPVQYQLELSVCPDSDMVEASGQRKRAHSSSDDIEEGFRVPNSQTKKGAKKGSSGGSKPRTASPAGRGRSPSPGAKSGVHRNLPVCLRCSSECSSFVTSLSFSNGWFSFLLRNGVVNRFYQRQWLMNP